jgi:hypothetical protein
MPMASSQHEHALQVDNEVGGEIEPFPQNVRGSTPSWDRIRPPVWTFANPASGRGSGCRCESCQSLNGQGSEHRVVCRIQLGFFSPKSYPDDYVCTPRREISSSDPAGIKKVCSIRWQNVNGLSVPYAERLGRLHDRIFCPYVCSV